VNACTHTHHLIELDLDSHTASDLLYFEDLNVNDRWLSDWREVTADDVADFAMLTGDDDPLHKQPSDGSPSPFGEPVAHGLLGLSILAGLSSQSPRAATLAFVGITDWQFEAPIFFSDRVQVVTSVEKLEVHGRRAGRVTWVRELLNQHSRIVQRGRFITLVSTRARARRIATPSQPLVDITTSVE
jgi:3-hydroxybutyryl-CoA dehydratase